MLTTLSKALLPMARTCLLRQTVPASTRLPALSLQSHLTATSRPFSQSTGLAYPRKDSQDKDSISTEATEYSKSGTDDEAARQESAAFDPSKTSPEEEKDTAGEGNGANPLEVSPANPDVSQQRGTTEGGAENSAESSSESGSDRKRSSGGGSPNKGKKVA